MSDLSCECGAGDYGAHHWKSTKCRMCVCMVTSVAVFGCSRQMDRYSREMCTGSGTVPSNRLNRGRQTRPQTGFHKGIAGDIPRISKQRFSYHDSICPGELFVLYRVFPGPYVPVTDYRNRDRLFQYPHLLQIGRTLASTTCRRMARVKRYPRGAHMF